jgi:drug/metabolite transporter (DMT)-like permease
MTALAETADRQSLWSSTASVLKRRVEIARWVTFAFSILGALLAAIASQLNDPPRPYFAIAGAVLLAVVSFVTSRLLGGLQITNWLRARTASEALKREAYKYAASVMTIR